MILPGRHPGQRHREHIAGAADRCRCMSRPGSSLPSQRGCSAGSAIKSKISAWPSSDLAAGADHPQHLLISSCAYPSTQREAVARPVRAVSEQVWRAPGFTGTSRIPECEQRPLRRGPPVGRPSGRDRDGRSFPGHVRREDGRWPQHRGQRIGPADDQGDLGRIRSALAAFQGAGLGGTPRHGHMRSRVSSECQRTKLPSDPVGLAPSPATLTRSPLRSSARRSRDRRLFPPMSRIRS